MSRKDRISLLILVAIFVVLQLMGLLGFFFGTGNMSSINYDRWAGYFIVIGTMTNMVLVVAIVAFLVPPIFRGIVNWIERGKDETDRKAPSTGTSLQHHYAAPITSIPTTVRERSEDDVQGDVSGHLQTTRRELREHAHAG